MNKHLPITFADRNSEIEKGQVLAFAEIHDPDSRTGFLFRRWAEGEPDSQLLMAHDTENNLLACGYLKTFQHYLWLTGWLVDPAARRHGLGRMLHCASYDFAHTHRISAVESVVNIENSSMIGLLYKLGHLNIGSMRSLVIKPKNLAPILKKNSGARYAKKEDIPAILALLNNSAHYKRMRGLFYENFIGHPLTYSFIRTSVESKMVVLEKDDTVIGGLVFLNPNAMIHRSLDPLGELGYVDGKWLDVLHFVLAHDFADKRYLNVITHIRDIPASLISASLDRFLYFILFERTIDVI